MRTATPVNFTLDLNGRSGPRSGQVAHALIDAIARGQVHDGDRLPSTRDLAATLGVSRTVVTSAYASLFAEGWLEGRHGSGTYVADVAPAPPAPAHAPADADAPGPTERAPGAGSLIELRPGFRNVPGPLPDDRNLVAKRPERLLTHV